MKKKTQYKKNTHSGFTLVEMLVYLVLTVLIATLLVQALVVVFQSNRNSFVYSNLRNSAYTAMESMGQQIRASNSIDYTHSTLYPSTPDVLQLNQTDVNGNPEVAKFATSSSGTLNFYYGSTTASLVLVGPITIIGTSVTQLIFTPINTGTSTAVRIQMTLSGTTAGVTRTAIFYSTAVLRGSY